MNKDATIGFIGLGIMGWPMATQLVNDGRNVLVMDADQSRAAAFATEVGGTAASGPEAFAQASVVVTMLPTSAIVNDVFLNEDTGVGQYLQPGTIVIEMSTSNPTDTLELAHALASRGVHVVDAPVSGLEPAAKAGTLNIMMGAENDEIAAVASDVVAPMSGRIFRTGIVGTGHAMKALNNLVGGTGFVVTSEALIIGQRFGLDPAVMLEIMNVSTGRNFNTEVVLPNHVLTGEFATGFTLGLLAKDVGIAESIAESMGIDARVCQAAVTRLREAAEALGPGVDHSRGYTYWEHGNSVN